MPLICYCLAARDTYFTFPISVSKFWRQLNSSLTHSADINPCTKTSSLSNPIESFKLASCCFLAAASSTDELLLSFLFFY